MIEERYRKDYDGEFVIVETKWTGGKKTQTREWVANPIINQHISGRAACIGSSINKDQFDYTVLQNHKGGLLSSKKLQTYGVSSIAKEMRLDFTVAFQQEDLESFIESKYQETNVVYTSTRQCIRNPGEFYLIPFNSNLCEEAIPIYLAAFDGHKEIFLLGYTNETISGVKNWQDQIKTIMDVYYSTYFIAVGQSTSMPERWFDSPNFKCMNYLEFRYYCDI